MPASRPLRIAIFCPTVSGAGGMESAIRNLMRGIQSIGDTPHLFLFGGSFHTAWLQPLPHTVIGSASRPRLSRLASYALGATRALLSWRPDAILCADTATLQMAHLGRALALRPRVPIASWLHFPLAEIRFKEKLPLANLHLTISQHIADDLRASLPPSDIRKIYVIGNALPSGPASPIPRPSGTPIFVYVGRLNVDDHKRVNDILLAVARLHGPWRLRIVGAAMPGEEAQTEQLHALAAQLGIADRVEWLGWQADPWAALPEATALISSSAREGLPMNLIEAANRGVPSVASNCTGSSEVIRPGQNGFLFPIADVDALARQLQTILDNPASLPSPDAVQRSVQQFSPAAVAQRLHEAFLAAQSPSRRS